MLTTDLNKPIIFINVELGINQQHSFQISFFSNDSSFDLGQDVIINRDGTPILRGVVTGYTYDAVGKIMTITGQDKNSYYYQHDQSEQPRNCANDHLTTIEDALNTLDARENVNVISGCPVISCFGYGDYNGATHDMIDRVCNSFGLNYFSDPTGFGYTLISGVLQEPNSYTAVAGYNLNQNSDLDSIISKIYIQKAVTSSQRRKIDVKNGSLNSTQTVRLVNPNHVLAAQGDPQFPIDYFICPWIKAFVTIDVPVSSNLYKVAVDIGEARQIAYINCNDSLANPAWKLEIWDNNPDVSQNGTAAARIGYISKGGVWQANSNEVARYVRVARDETVNGATATVFPTYDGVVVSAYVWEQIPGANVEAWSSSYNSGDVDGRPDYNVISEEMYPNKTLFDSQNLGPQIAKRDSLVMQRGFTLPGIRSGIDLLDSVALPYDGVNYPIPVTSVSYQAAPGQEYTNLRGEW